MWIDDRLIQRCSNDYALDLWIPDRPIVVLGRSNKAASECRSEVCAEDGVEVLQRYGGGGTVLLHPGCVIIGISMWVRQYYANDYYFQEINGAVIDALAKGWESLSRLGQDGLSDIVDGEKKVAGTSLFRSRNYLLYQGSVLVDANIDLIDRYLCHPSNEPEYRQRRPHGEFLTDLHTSADATVDEVLACLQQNLWECLKSRLSDELISSRVEQVPHVLGKIARG